MLLNPDISSHQIYPLHLCEQKFYLKHFVNLGFKNVVNKYWIFCTNLITIACIKAKYTLGYN